MARPRTLRVNTGEKYGRLTVALEVEGNSYSRRILCKCDCGGSKIVSLVQLLSGNTQSCGCLKREMRIKQNTTHGFAGHSLYSVWSSMKGRCFNSNDNSYKNYGARGVIVCEEWLEFESFYKWAVGAGYKRGLTVERKDNNGNYEPSNCELLPFEEQSKNRRSNHYITYNCQTKTMAQWSRDLNINYSTLKDRIRSGWSIEKSFTTSIKKKAEVA